MEIDEGDSLIDIIGALSKRFMNDVVEDIFDYLDYQSLRSAEKVSQVWYGNIYYGNVWKRLFERNVILLKEWKEMLNIVEMKFSDILKALPQDLDFFRLICHLIGDSVQRLAANWAQSRHTWYQFEEFSQPELDSALWIPGSLSFEFDKRFIGRGQRDGSIVLWNRWTWRVHATYEAVLQPNIIPGSNTVRALQFNDKFVVASYFGGEISVWDLDTGLLMQVFDEMDVGNFMTHYIPINNLALGNSPRNSHWLLSCLASQRGRDAISFRNINDPDVLVRMRLDRQFRVKRLLMTDNNYAIARMANTRANQDRIEIRILPDLALCGRIDLPHHMGSNEFAHRSCKDDGIGLLATSSGRLIQLWDADRAVLIRQLHSSSTILFVQFIGDQYLISCNANGKMEIWNQKLASSPCQQTGDDGDCLLNQFDATAAARRLCFPVIRADEYQIALIPERSENHSELHLIDFLQLPDKLDG